MLFRKEKNKGRKQSVSAPSAGGIALARPLGAVMVETWPVTGQKKGPAVGKLPRPTPTDFAVPVRSGRFWGLCLPPARHSLLDTNSIHFECIVGAALRLTMRVAGKCRVKCQTGGKWISQRAGVLTKSGQRRRCRACCTSWLHS